VKEVWHESRQNIGQSSKVSEGGELEDVLQGLDWKPIWLADTLWKGVGTMIMKNISPTTNAFMLKDVASLTRITHIVVLSTIRIRVTPFRILLR